MKKVLLSLIFLSTIASAQTIACGGEHSLAVCSNNTATAWGRNSFGSLGNGTNTDSHVPVYVSSLSGITAIAGGEAHSLALKSDSTVWAWGWNAEGELGNGTNNGSNVPVQTNFLTGVMAIAGGGLHSLALKNDGTVWTWGYNGAGELGNGTIGTNAASNIPVQVNSLTGIIAIAGGYMHSLALKNDGTVWAWGWNNCGQLGNGTNNAGSNIPVQVDSLSGIIAISAGYVHSIALKNDGTVWVWGNNAANQLANGTSSNVPLQISSLEGIISISSEGNHSLALKNDSTVWILGDSTFPFPISSLSGITAIAGGEFLALALKNDGTLWAWGRNGYGQVGNGTTSVDCLLPVQVIGLCTTLTTAVNDISPDGDELDMVKIFPNPSSGLFTVNLKNQTVETKICVRDVLGNCVFNNVAIKNNNQEIDLSSQPKGIYFAEMICGSDRSTKKIIIE